MSLGAHKGEVFPTADGRYVWLFIDSINRAKVIIKNGVITKKYCGSCKQWMEIENFGNAFNTARTRRLRPLREEYASQGKVLLLGLGYECKPCHAERWMEYYFKKHGKRRRLYEDFTTHDKDGVELVECRECHNHFYQFDMAKPYVLKSGRTKRIRVCKRCLALRIEKYRALRCARKVYREGSPVFDALKGAQGRDSLKKVCNLWGIYPNRKFSTADEGELRRELSRLRIKKKWWARHLQNKKKVSQNPQGRNGNSDVPMRDLQAV